VRNLGNKGPFVINGADLIYIIVGPDGKS